MSPDTPGKQDVTGAGRHRQPGWRHTAQHVWQGRKGACLTLTQGQNVPAMSGRLASGGPLFPTIAISAALFRIASARRRFRRPFFIFQRLQPFGPGPLKTTVASLPFVEGRVTEPVFAAKASGLRVPGHAAFQTPDVDVDEIIIRPMAQAFQMQ